MKKIIYIFILPTILFLTSCSKGGGGASGPEIPCDFTGTWEGQYTGGDNGIMSGVVNSRCDVSGTIYSNNLGMFDDISGTIESDGSFYGSVTTGAIFEGQINENYGSGIWSNPIDGISGTWSMNKQSVPSSYNFNCDVVFYLDYSASAYMILNNIPYYTFYDGFGNQLGSISNQYYWNTPPPCTYQTNESTVTNSLSWTGTNSSQITATLSWSAYAPGNTTPTYSHDHIVTANICNQIGLTLKKIESYQATKK